MSSTSSTFKKAAPPPEPAAAKSGSAPAYARFIPREELGAFSAWNPSSIDGTSAPPAEAPAPAAPTEAELQAQLAAARQGGYQDGYRDGLVALEEFKQSFAAQSTQQIGALLRSLDSQFAALESQIAQAVAASAVSLARQVVIEELHARPEVVARVATEAVNAVLLSARHITLRVHPLDLPLIETGAAEAIAARDARLLADDTIERGGCRVEADIGSVDARIASRWAQAAQALGADVPWQGKDES